MKSRCVPEIALKASNDSGGYYFMNIFTGKRMHSYNWKYDVNGEELIEYDERGTIDAYVADEYE